jgi:hypothetical protein
MGWGLSASTFWRHEDGEVFLSNDQTVLRLNAASSRLFFLLMQREEIDHPSDLGLSALAQQLLDEGIIERTALAGLPDQRRIGHLPLTVDPQV